MDNLKSLAVVRSHHMLALLHIISSQETRYYLNGVFVEPYKDGGAVMTATDGHKMVCIYDPNAYCVGPPQIWRIREHVGVIKANTGPKSKRSAHGPNWLRYEEFVEPSGETTTSVFRLAVISKYVESSEDARKAVWDSPFCTSVARDVAIDGTFPEYGRVIPRPRLERSGAVLGAQVLIDACKFAQEFVSTATAPVSFEFPDERSPGVFRVKDEYGAEAMGVLMPRTGERTFSAPAWLASHTGIEGIGPAEYEAIADVAEKRATEQVRKAA